jgi:hypothetical protein
MNESSYNTAEKTYISVDVEHTGESSKHPGSVVSIGACVVGNIEETFYRELKPRNDGFHSDALTVAIKGLQSVDSKTIEKGSSAIMAALRKNAMDPKIALSEYQEWVIGLQLKHPVEAAAPIKYDGGLMAEYYRENSLENPFGWNGEDINSLLRGLTCDPSSHIVTLGLRSGENPHNALRDAQIQAIEMEIILRLMSTNRTTKGRIFSIIQNKGLVGLHKHDLTKYLMQRGRKVIEKINATPINENLHLAEYPL